MLPRNQWHTLIGQPVLVHTTMGTYRGHLHRVTGTHIHLLGHRLVSASNLDERSVAKLTEVQSGVVDLVYYPGAALALPLAAIVGVTVLGLGAMGGW